MRPLEVVYQLGAQDATHAFQKYAKEWCSEGHSNVDAPVPRHGAHEHGGNNVGIESPLAVKKLRDAMRKKEARVKLADPSLGDPNYWQGGSQQQQQAPQPQNAEQAISLLPGGTFQGANIKIAPDGQKATSVKVSPDALVDPATLQQFFQLPEPGTKIEISAPDQVPTVPVQGGGVGSGVPVPGGAMPADPGMQG